MRCLLTVLFFLACQPFVAHSAPLLYYDSATGNLRIVNDGEWSGGNNALMGAFIFKSPSGRLKKPTNKLPAPTVLDTGDVPQFIALIYVPHGTFDLLGAVQPGTPINQLSVDIHPALGFTPEPVAVLVPEPTTVAVGGLAFSALAALNGRRLFC